MGWFSRPKKKEWEEKKALAESQKDSSGSYASPQAEFVAKSGKLMVVMFNPSMTKEKKRVVLHDFVDSLSDSTFLMYAEQILTMVNFQKTAKDFADHESQKADFMAWIPRYKSLALFEGLVDNAISEARKRG